MGRQVPHYAFIIHFYWPGYWKTAARGMPVGRRRTVAESGGNTGGLLRVLKNKTIAQNSRTYPPPVFSTLKSIIFLIFFTD
jgi:hypothetical protein